MQIPILSLLAITIVLQFLGFIWYGPFFGKLWSRTIGLRLPNEMSPEECKEQQKKMIPNYILNFIMCFLTVATIWLFGRVMGGVLVLALIFWLGFIVPTTAGGAMWSGKTRKMMWQMFALTAGFQLVAFIVSALLIVWWA